MSLTKEEKESARRKVLRGVCLNIIKLLKTHQFPVDYICSKLEISQETAIFVIEELYPNHFVIERKEESGISCNSVKVTNIGIHYFIDNARFDI